MNRRAFRLFGWRQFGRLAFAGAGLAVLARTYAFAANEPPVDRPNVLLIVVDDLNDWVGAFGGDAAALTPELDRFASEGTVTFDRAYCPGPVCGPSRSALLSGFMPHRTGVYNNHQNMRRSELVRRHATLPEYFRQHGYHALSRGKIFHRHAGDVPGTVDEGHWAFDHWEPWRRADHVDPERRTSRRDGLIAGEPERYADLRGGGGSDFAWGPTIEPKEKLRDWSTAEWAAERLRQLPDNRPFFLAVGISQPHLPWHVPEEFFARHPLDSIKVPAHRSDDLDDIVDVSGEPVRQASEDFRWVSRDPWLFRQAVQAYLAACSYADACVGVVLEGLRRSDHADNTVVVVLGDHGWHLGEKLRFRKATLWAEATRVPLMLRAPEHSESTTSSRVVNLVDLYPTLIELCGLPVKPELDGRSFAPLVHEPARPWPYPTLSISPGGKGAAVIDERWYFIRQGGVTELYDMRADPHQWTNLTRSNQPDAAEA